MNCLRVCCWMCVALSASPVLATGLLVPSDTSLPPLAIKSHRVNVEIDNQVATTRVEQVFINHTHRDLEAKYIFPLPAGAAIRDFAMMINGQRVSGELVEKDRARQVYQQIVSRMQDPGLLEYLGNDLFRVSVYPVPRNGTQRIELTYAQVLTQDAGLTRYLYPLRTGEKASRTMDDFSMGITLTSQVPIKSIYSPTHDVGISNKSEHRAIIGFEKNQAHLDQDFELFYAVSEKDFGLNVLTYRPDENADGYFLLLLSPRSDLRTEALVQRDVSFVFDTSGSMSGAKIAQAKRALKHCIGRLNDGDRFNIVRFSTDAEPYSETMVPISDENRKKANAFIDALQTRGGTNIDDALSTALQRAPEASRPHVIVFLTDGLPTLGVTDKDAIIRNALDRRRGTLRIFTFGVGSDVNTHLLDALSGKTGGVTEYVKDDEDIEVKVSRFFDKASHPVLTDLTLVTDKVRITQMYPRELPDLFHGSQLVVLGRYTDHSHVALTLTGHVNEKTEKFVYEATFPARDDDHAFIEPLWANRKVGYLLDAIRLNGETKELVDEVVALSKQYGIQTPYTSYLVLEDEAAYKQHGIVRSENLAFDTPRDALALRRLARTVGRPAAVPPIKRRGRADTAAGPAQRSAGGPAGSAGFEGELRVLRESLAQHAIDVLGSDELGDLTLEAAGQPESALEADPIDFRAQSGASAVRAAKALSAMKSRDRVDRSATGNRPSAERRIKIIDERKMVLLGTVWVDSRFTAECRITEVKYASPAYFRLFEARRDLRDLFKLGTQLVIVTARGKALVITDKGVTELAPGEIVELFVDASAPRQDAGGSK